jgi:hypothetical protein
MNTLTFSGEQELYAHCKSGSLGIAAKKKFAGGVFGAKRQKHPQIYQALRLFPKTRKRDCCF